MKFNKIILATKNKHKIKEITTYLGSLSNSFEDYTTLQNIPDINEDGNSFFENAFKKAKTVFEKYKLPALADDSGLVVPALNGDPGVHSARYAGENATPEEMIKKLLNNMQDIPDNERSAYFETTMVFYFNVNFGNIDTRLDRILGIKPGRKALRFNNNREIFLEASGKVFGTITREPRGEQGFGYDPVFIPDNSSKTFAEMSMAEKNKISHRIQALKKLIVKFNYELMENNNFVF